MSFPSTPVKKENALYQGEQKIFRAVRRACSQRKAKPSSYIPRQETNNFVCEAATVHKTVLSHLDTQARSTVIRIFLNLQLSLCGFKIYPSTRSVFKSNSPVHTHLILSGFTLVLRAGAPLQ